MHIHQFIDENMIILKKAKIIHLKFALEVCQ